MLAHINIYLGFIEEAERLLKYPEVTSSDTAYFKLGNMDIKSRNPIHNGKYDARLFDALTNHVRKIFILHKEPISLENIHGKASVDLSSDPTFAILDAKYIQIKAYLNSNMNNVTQFSFSLPGSIIGLTTVFELLNNYLAATSQHSKPKAQSIIDELNILTYGALPEMVRVMIIDLSNLVTEYVTILRKMIAK